MKKLLIVLAILLASFAQANAYSITPETWDLALSEYIVPPSETNIQNYISSQGITLPSLLYKSNTDGSEEGLLSGSYQTIYNSDQSGATIDYVSGPYASGLPLYLLVKDGRHDPSFYLFELSVVGWDRRSRSLGFLARWRIDLPYRSLRRTFCPGACYFTATWSGPNRPCWFWPQETDLIFRL